MLNHIQRRLEVLCTIKSKKFQQQFWETLDNNNKKKLLNIVANKAAAERVLLDKGLPPGVEQWRRHP